MRTSTLYVVGLDDSVTDAVLKEEFSKHACIERVTLVKDKDTRKSRGFGYIMCETPDEATKAMKEMDGRILAEKPIKVKYSTAETPEWLRKGDDGGPGNNGMRGRGGPFRGRGFMSRGGPRGGFGDRGRGDFGNRGRGLSRGRGNFAPRGRGDFAPRGRGDFAPRGRDDFAPRGRGDFAPRGRGEFRGRGDSRGRGQFTPRGRGDFAPRGRGDFAPRGRGGSPSRGNSYTSNGPSPRGRGGMAMRGRPAPSEDRYSDSKGPTSFNDTRPSRAPPSRDEYEPASKYSRGPEPTFDSPLPEKRRSAYDSDPYAAPPRRDNAYPDSRDTRDPYAPQDAYSRDPVARPNRDSYNDNTRDGYRADPYAERKSAYDERPSADAYRAPTAPASSAYGATRDTYGTAPRDTYGSAAPRDTYGQSARGSYGQVSRDPYGQTAAPSARDSYGSAPRDPYATTTRETPRFDDYSRTAPKRDSYGTATTGRLSPARSSYPPPVGGTASVRSASAYDRVPARDPYAPEAKALPRATGDRYADPYAGY